MRVRVSAPGKSILIGEHAAVYQRPALVAAISCRLTAELAASSGPPDSVRLDLPQIGVTRKTTWSEILTYTRSRQARWQVFAEQPSAHRFDELRGEDPAHLVQVALGETALHLGQTHGPALALRITSDIPVGAGFGSSAATAVAVSHAYSAFCGVELPLAELHHLAQEIERRQHGSPSGVDSAAVLHGGLIWARKQPSGELAIEPLALRSPLLAGIRVFHTGPPPEATGAVVAAVRQLRERDPVAFDQLLDRLEAATWAVRRGLERTPADPAELLSPLRHSAAGLAALGVVPAAVQRIIVQVEAAGGAAKISGAGSLQGPGAGSLLVYHPQPSEIAGWSFLQPLTALTLQLGAPGVQRESLA